MGAPLLGRTLTLRLSAAQAQEANARLIASGGSSHGNFHKEGDPVPLIVVRDWGGAVNGRALLDGETILWVCSACQGDQPGQWSFPGEG